MDNSRLHPQLVSSKQEDLGSFSKIGVYCHWLLKEGFRPQTIQSHIRTLRFLARNVNSDDPETVREFLASRKSSGGRKPNVVAIYSKYSKYSGIAFSEPRYAREDGLPFVPLQKELETILDASSRNLKEAALLRLLYETGMRIGEATRLQFRDFDFERKTVRVIPEKGSRARELKLSDLLVSMLKDVFNTYPNRPFPTFSGGLGNI